MEDDYENYIMTRGRLLSGLPESWTLGPVCVFNGCFDCDLLGVNNKTDLATDILLMRPCCYNKYKTKAGKMTNPNNAFVMCNTHLK